jgi:hypothetical protein
MMSHVDPSKGSGGAPCLRGMGRPMQEEKEYVQLADPSGSAPKEAWYADNILSCAVVTYTRSRDIKGAPRV